MTRNLRIVKSVRRLEKKAFRKDLTIVGKALK